MELQYALHGFMHSSRFEDKTNLRGEECYVHVLQIGFGLILDLDTRYSSKARLLITPRYAGLGP